MKKYSFFLILLITNHCFAQKSGKVPVTAGVSYELATYRKSVISHIQYTLQFNIPVQKDSAIIAGERLSFYLKSVTQPLQLDCKLPAGNIKSVQVNGRTAAIDLQEEHLLISEKMLKPGANKIDIQFIAGNASLNRNEEYVYALFVPDHARTVFPCFDQPDLKARFLLTLEVPTGWKALANAMVKDSLIKARSTIYHFAGSDLLSTYLFSFTAGKYNSRVQWLDKRTATFLYRETDTAKLRLSMDSIFRIHGEAVSFLEKYTGIPFPFQKMGFVAIPDFQFGGMEHPGEVQYKASSLFLDGGATRDMLVSRISLIAHETAHMWFGDLVTMRWFNDVWMKEVFANFMADKVAEKIMGEETFNLKFLQDHYPAAYGIDRTGGAHPIRQQLDNLQDAGSMYGNIIYHKAPIMMRQLELLMGKDSFRLGLQEYLKKYAYSNAGWPQLISILSRHCKADLYEWNKVWVNEPGRPVFNQEIRYEGGRISRFTLRQQAEQGSNRTWPQQFTITLFYTDQVKTISVNMQDAEMNIREATGLAAPLYMLLNANGMGYGIFPADQKILPHLYRLPSPLQRASAYINLYENMLSGRSVRPDELLNLLADGLNKEQNELNLRLLTSYIGTIYWTFLAPARRAEFTTQLEEKIWHAVQQQTAAGNQKTLFKAYQDIYETDSAKSRMYAIWQQQKTPAGITLSEDDYTSLALSIALKNDTAIRVLTMQQHRIANTDRKKRLQFLMPAVSADTAVRNRFFTSLQNRSNREKEAWVVMAMAYLHHPLRQSVSIRYILQSLEMLEEIKRTGDIFFPQNWLGAILGSYQSPVATQMVKDFLQQHPDYNPKLKAKLLQAADNVFRAAQLVK